MACKLFEMLFQRVFSLQTQRFAKTINEGNGSLVFGMKRSLALGDYTFYFGLHEIESYKPFMIKFFANTYKFIVQKSLTLEYHRSFISQFLNFHFEICPFNPGFILILET